MSFTSLEIVKKHLTEYRLGSKLIENEPLILPAADPVNLQYANIEENSEKVKAKEKNTPTSEEATFDGEDKVTLTYNELIPDTVVVANNSSMGKIFTENIDFTVDYDQGVIIRITAGAIETSADVYIWYQHYKVYSRDVDYTINYNNGYITRLASGDIEAGQLVYIDYQSLYGNITDEAINNAILEASSKIRAIIDPEYESSTDQALITSETYSTLAIICKIKAIEAAGNLTISSSGYRGDFWLQLSTSYYSESMQMLIPYSLKTNPLSSPKITKSS